MISGLNSHIYVVIFGMGIAYATGRFRYYQIAMILKWLAAVLFAYVVTAFLAGPDWGHVLRDTFIPSLPQGHAAWQNLVAILGTTISPYLFFWQTSQEVEEEKAMGRRLLVQREGATTKEIINRKLDVGVGTFFSNLVMFFIILTAALVLISTGSQISILQNKPQKHCVRLRELWHISFTRSASLALVFLPSQRSPAPPHTHLRKRFRGSRDSTNRFAVRVTFIRCWSLRYCSDSRWIFSR